MCSSDRRILFEVTISLESFHPARVEGAETSSPADLGSTLAAFQTHSAVTTFNPRGPELSDREHDRNAEAEPLAGCSLALPHWTDLLLVPADTFG